MKNRNYFFLFFWVFIFNLKATNIQAQTSIVDVFNPDTPITYMGIDFSNAKCFGEERFDVTDITRKINDLVINEYDKYNVTEALKKNFVNIKFDLTWKLNAKIEADNFFTYSPGDLNKMKEEDIQKIVSMYDFSSYEKNKGIGLVFIVDNINKKEDKESVWVTFLDMNSNKVIFTEKVIGKSGGFGLRNYWVRPFYEIIKDIKSTLFKQWKKKYNG